MKHEMSFEWLSGRLPHLRFLIALDGAAFEGLMGREWSQAYPKIPLLLNEKAVADLTNVGSLHAGVIRTAMERTLSDETVVEDRSTSMDGVRGIYRDLLLRWVPDLFARLEQQIQANLQDPEALLTSARIILSLWQSDPRQDPGAWKVWFIAGWAHRQKNDVERAATYLGRAVELNPLSCEAISELGLCRVDQERMKEAGELFDFALKADGDNVMALCNAAGFRIQTGRRDEAHVLLERARRLAPDDPFVVKLIGIASG